MKTRKYRRIRLTPWLALVALALPGCGPGSKAGEKIKVAGIFPVSVEEPYAAVLHQALLQLEREGEMIYDFTDQLPPEECAQSAREYAERGYKVVFGDASRSEESLRHVAGDFPEVAFCFLSGFGPTAPNFSVFDCWVQESAYLCGLLAGKMTKNGAVGAVGGEPIPRTNRLLNAFALGVKEANPAARVLYSFTGARFEPSRASAAAAGLIAAGADIVYGETYGVFGACRRQGAYAFGNLSDQNSLAPDTVVSGTVWDLCPMVRYVLETSRDRDYQGLDLSPFGLMAVGGNQIAPYHSFERRIPPAVKEMVEARRAEIISGRFRVPILEQAPVSD